MVIKTTMQRLRNGEKIMCKICNNGYYKPLNYKVDISRQTYFVCDSCGSAVTATLKMPSITKKRKNAKE